MTQKSLDALRSVEWGADEFDRFGELQQYCPYCGEQREDGHAETCLLAQALSDCTLETMTSAAQDVLAERRRQVEAEGWSPEHDDAYANGVLADAAASYALNAGVAMRGLRPLFWPWHDNWWKPTTPRRDLVKAAALILAEIERLDRVGAANTKPSSLGDCK